MGRETDRRVRAPFPPRHEVLPPQEKPDTVIPPPARASQPRASSVAPRGRKALQAEPAPALIPLQGIPRGHESPVVTPGDAQDQPSPGPRSRGAAPQHRAKSPRGAWGRRRVHIPARAAALDGALSFMQG